MENETICRFNFNRSSDLVCSNFVYETGKIGTISRPAKTHMAILVSRGSGEAVTGAARFPVGVGTLFFVLQGESYAVFGTEDLAYLYVSFEGRRARELTDRARIGGAARAFADRSDLLPLWQEALSRTDEGNVDLWGEAVLLWSLARVTPTAAAENTLSAKAAKLADEHFSDPALSLAAVANQLGYDAKYLSFVFRRERGVTFSEYLRDLRVRHAAFLMEQGVASVKNVAWLSGFEDPLYFSKVFTKTVGCPPRVYMARVQTSEQK